MNQAVASAIWAYSVTGSIPVTSSSGAHADPTEVKRLWVSRAVQFASTGVIEVRINASADAFGLDLLCHMGKTESEATAVARELRTGTTETCRTLVVRARLGIEIGIVAVFVGSDGDPFMGGSTRRAGGCGAEVGPQDISF